MTDTKTYEIKAIERIAILAEYDFCKEERHRQDWLKHNSASERRRQIRHIARILIEAGVPVDAEVFKHDK